MREPEKPLGYDAMMNFGLIEALPGADRDASLWKRRFLMESSNINPGTRQCRFPSWKSS
jgi:hypothetical protein